MGPESNFLPTGLDLPVLTGGTDSVDAWLAVLPVMHGRVMHGADVDGRDGDILVARTARR